MNKQMNVVIFIADSNGGYPVPAVNGGSVSTLIEHLVEENEKKLLMDLTIVSLYDKEANKKAQDKYPHINFVWVKVPRIIKCLDNIAYYFAKMILKKKKTLSYISVFTLIDYILKASRHLKKYKYDKVILENNIPMAWIIKLSNYKGDYYYHFHNVPRINGKCKDVFENATGYLCVSKYVAKQIQSAENPIGPVKSEKTKVLYNCVDINLFRRIDDLDALDAERKKFKISKDDNVVVFVGRLSEEKGIDKLLEAIPLVKSSGLKVLIVGSLINNQTVVDEYQMKLKKLASEAKDRVIFTGYIDQLELPLLYNISDVAVLPSMWDEPAGLTMVEAMACGLPVITTNSGGIPEYVSDCAIILNRDVDIRKNIAVSIEQVITNKNQISYMRDKGITRALNHLASENYLDNFIEEISK